MRNGAGLRGPDTRGLTCSGCSRNDLTYAPVLGPGDIAAWRMFHLHLCAACRDTAIKVVYKAISAGQFDANRPDMDRYKKEK